MSTWNADSAKAHLAQAQLNAQANVERMNRDGGDFREAANRHLDGFARNRGTKTQKIIGLRFIAGQLSDAASGYGACKKHCNHCCHIGVDVSKEEAQLISRQIGRKIAQPATRSFFDSDGTRSPHLNSPCTFLKDGGCSIYESRPLLCRTLVNMDNDERLCRLIDGAVIDVPYLNLEPIKAVYAQHFLGAEFADIRDWFPAD